jgi:hypothetical protein
MAVQEKEKFTDIRIRQVSRELARRFRSALAADGVSVVEWFTQRAAETAQVHEDRIRAGKGKGK